MKITRTAFRIFVGIVFIFSGFVKGIDPLGTVFKMNDYFLAFDQPWAMQFSLPLSIFLCAVEFMIGVSLFFNLMIRKSAWLLLPMMIFFTILTFFDATYNIVPDCGCFGDAVKLTNVQTFIKNLVLMCFVVPIFAWRNKYRSLLSSAGEWAVLGIIALAFTLLSVWCYRYLPVVDFMSWKVGNTINKTGSADARFYVTYKNIKTGEEKEYLAPDYPWNDSVWMSEWVFLSQRAEDPSAGNGMALMAEDAAGNDVTPSITGNPDYQFIFVTYDLEGADPENFTKILPLYKQVEAAGYSFVCISNALPEVIREFRMANGTAFEFYSADDVVLKTMVRSNPGLILIKNGIVIEKWHYRDFPSWKTLREKYLK
jgi:uncharacterized membrane protein YphA (DoxX/SURF4 family)